MDIYWKILSISMIVSAIITCISGLILAISKVIQPYPTYLEYLSNNPPSNKTSITVAIGGNGPPYYLHLWTIIGIGFICFLVLAIIIYIVIRYYHKRII